MSRTHKGQKGPGWEPWSNKHEKAAQKADFVEGEAHWTEEICQGCHLCVCVKCGTHIVVREDKLVCIGCGHEEVDELRQPVEGGEDYPTAPDAV